MHSKRTCFTRPSALSGQEEEELAGTSHADVNTGLGDVAAVGVHISEQTVGKPANCVKSSKRLNGIREVNKSENKTEKQR